MRDVFRTLMLAGFGALDQTAEKGRALLDDLVRRGELASEEADELGAALKRGMNDRREAIDRQVRAAVDEAMARQQAASQATLSALQARVESLAQVVARLTEPTVES